MSFEHSPYQYQMHSNRNATKGMHLNTIPGILDILNAFHHLINSIICLSFFFLHTCISLCSPPFVLPPSSHMYVFEWSNM